MKKPLKINPKSMPERGRKKGCQNDGKRNQKGAQMEPEIRSKWPQGAKGEPKGRPKGQKGRKRKEEKRKEKKKVLEETRASQAEHAGPRKRPFAGKAFMRIL